MTGIASVSDCVRDVLENQADELRVAGAVVAVDISGERAVHTYGSANLNTGQEFTRDTGFLVGSVTKVLVTTIVLRLAEQGAVDLDAPVSRYVPEFTLSDEEAASAITVCMLLNHTNGIDADSLLPDGVRGRDAGRQYTAELTHRGVLFDPGTWVHYSNPGFVVASRIIEEQTGLPFELAIERELFRPCGMSDATAVQTQAFLRRTAIGAFCDAKTGALHATTLFTIPESIGGAGGTPIVTVDDMLAFGRMHLNGGTAQDGTRILSGESVTAMQTSTFDTGIPSMPPVGLGWWLVPVAGTTALCHGGGSAGGAASFCVLPEYDAIVVSFVTGGLGGGAKMTDVLHNAALEGVTGNPIDPMFALDPAPPSDDLGGEYLSFQVRTNVAKEGDSLVVTTANEFYDDDHARVLTAFGLDVEPVETRYASVHPGIYAPEGVEYAALGGLLARASLLAEVPASDGRRRGLQRELRYIPKVSG